MMKASDKNNIIYILSYALRSAALLTATGSLMQTFLTVIGMSSEQIYIHTSLVGAVNVIIILLFARFADHSGLLLRCALVQLTGAVLFLCYLPLCIMNGAPTAGFILLLTAGCLQSVTTALHTVCDYKLPYYIFRKDEYGAVMAFCGILSSGISFGIGALMTALSVKADYSDLMLYAFVTAFIFTCAAAVLTLRLKNIALTEETVKPLAEPLKKKAGTLEVIRAPVFSKLIPANLLRGFASGMTLVFAVIAAENLGYSEQITTAAVSVQSVASLMGCTVFGFMSKKISPRIAVFSGSLTFLLFPLILIPERPVLFLALTGIIIFGRTLIDYAVPSLLLYAVPAELAGPYNAYRMILHNGGSLLATSLAAFVPVEGLIIAAAAFQLISGSVFLLLPLLKKASPRKNR